MEVATKAQPADFVPYDTKRITADAYTGLNDAFNFFNDRLWAGKLPPVMITLQRKRNAHGYFHPRQFAEKNGHNHLHEIALNPDTMDRADNEAVSTLVHEMAHLWQEVFGKPSRKGYHNAQWAAEMDRIGLTPSATGQPDGARTGPKCSHYIADGGQFKKLFNELQVGGFRLRWHGCPEVKISKPKDSSKTKFTCPECEAIAWAKSASNIVCGDCNRRMNENE